MIKISLPNQQVEVAPGTTIRELVSLLSLPENQPIAAKVNNSLTDLHTRLEEDSQIELLDISSGNGFRIYQNSLICLLGRVVNQYYPDARLQASYSVSSGLYCEIFAPFLVTEHDIEQIKKHMQEMIDADEPFLSEDIPREEAIRIFAEAGRQDKVDLYSFGKVETVPVYRYGPNYYDSFSTPLVPSAGYLSSFDIKYYPPGLVLLAPRPDNPKELPEFIEQKKLFQIFNEQERWGKILNIEDLAALNRRIDNNGISEMIKIAEALHEKKIARIADEIAEKRAQIRLILIAGPSSSGKTTFSKRLAIQLRVNGIRPTTVSLDDYFLDREHTPRDENGEYDFESLQAIDIKLFNEHLIALINGEEVEIPRFDFTCGARLAEGTKLKIEKNQPIIVEGIHGLNDKLTHMIPAGMKYKIYVSALTQLNIDDHNRIPTTDNRLVRRIVRDFQFRNHNALETMQRWPSVRKGEEMNIFPFQEEADVMFNSALVYELAVLKKYALPQLEKISHQEVEYAEAQRLLRFLSFFGDIDEKEIPPTSILREFIGQSSFSY